MNNRDKLSPNGIQTTTCASDDSLTVVLSELFLQQHGESVFSENSFERFEFESPVLHVILDCVGTGEEEVAVAYVRGRARETIILSFEELLFRDDTCLIVADRQKLHYLIVLPILSREFDEHGRISKEKECLTKITNRELIVKPSCDLGCSFNVYRARDVLTLAEPNRYNIERRPFAIYGELNARPLALSEHMIEGKIYDPRWRERVGNKRTCQEQVAYLLYHYYGMLAQSTDKLFYLAIQAIIAYTVVLRLRDDGLFLHGEWSDEMETHFRYEAEGLQLLTKHYKLFGGKKIASRCQRIAKYILKYADDLGENGLWFLHDTLENSKKVEIGYPKLLPSRAFEKDLRNTFALNTHLCSLIALALYTDVFEDADTQNDVEMCLKALRRVLSASGGDTVFSLLYAVHDKIFHWQSRISRLIKKYCTRLLLQAKKAWPRLVMSNGAIERDLSASAFSRRYHVVNIKDLLKLQRIRKLPWVGSVILRGFDYAVISNFTRGDIFGHPGGKYWAEVLLGCLTNQEDVLIVRKYLHLLGEYRDTLIKAGVVWPIDIISELNPSKPWHAAMRNLSLNSDLFEFSFKRDRYWVLLGDRPNTEEFCVRKVIRELSLAGVHVFEAE